MKLNATNTNFETLETIAADAIKTLETSNRPHSRRCINAIKKAVAELQENCYWNFDGKELVMMSTTSNDTYTPNGVCQCKAFTEHKQPCRHRASKRLLEKYAELG